MSNPLIHLTAARLREIMREAYLDGLDDGRGLEIIDFDNPNNPLDAANEELWSESVTADQHDLIIERVRKGKPA